MTVQNVANVAALRTLAGTSNPAVYVEGYSAAGDGGGGLFYYNSGDTSSGDNGATIFVSSNGSRFYRSWAGEAFNVLWAGADRTGNNASDAAFAACASVSSVIYAPVGRYKLNNAFNYSIASPTGGFTLFGDGTEQTVLYFVNNSGVNVTYSSNSTVIGDSVYIHDMSITAGTANAGSAVALIYSSTNSIPSGATTLSNLHIRGDDGIANFFWTTGISVNGPSTVNITGCVITSASSASTTSGGNGIYLVGNSVGSIVYSIDNCVLDFLQNGIIYGNYIQGVTVSGCNFTNVGSGIVDLNNESGLDQLSVWGCQFQSYGSNLYILSDIGNVQIFGNLFTFGTTSSNVSLINGKFSNFAIYGNNFGGNINKNTNGLVMNGGNAGIITGNAFTNIGGAIILGSSTSFINVQSNVYQNVSTVCLNQAGSANTVGGGSA